MNINNHKNIAFTAKMQITIDPDSNKFTLPDLIILKKGLIRAKSIIKRLPESDSVKIGFSKSIITADRFDKDGFRHGSKNGGSANIDFRHPINPMKKAFNELHEWLHMHLHSYETERLYRGK